MQATYAPESGLLLLFNPNERRAGVVILEQLCEMYEAQGVDVGAIRHVIEVMLMEVTIQ